MKLTVGLPKGDRSERLQRDVLDHLGGVPALEDLVALIEPSLDIAPADHL